MKKHALQTIIFFLFILSYASCINNPSQPIANPPQQVQTVPSNPNAQNVPQNVLTVWESIKQTGHAPDGYSDARPFENREGLLPAQDASGTAISYQVWNVKPGNGNPGRERLVTGSDHSAWFTNDGFHSFSKLGSNTVVGNEKKERPGNNTSQYHASGNVPSNVAYVLNYVKQNGHAPDGYVGGRVFGNYQHRLPETASDGSRINYQEWDVNPKVQGRNRGTDRLITGSDGRSWYTTDHYNTFTQVQ